MVALVENKNGNLLTTSKIVSDSFSKIHRDVMRTIKNLDCSEEFRVRNFTQSSYISEQNKVLDCFEITRDGFAFLCMGFTGKEAAAWKEKYILAFNQMEKSLNTIDNRMNKLSIEAGEIKDAGTHWSKLGREINSAKKKNKALCDQLVGDVQLKLGLKE